LSGHVVVRRPTGVSPLPLLREPVWTETQVDPSDIPYFHFFLAHGADALIYSELFPRVIPEIFRRTFNCKPLQRSILAICSLAVDQALQRPLVRALTHKQYALSLLQQNLSSGEISEETAVSIFLLLYMDCFSGSEIAQGHLRGFYLVLKHLNLNMEQPEVWKNASPMLLIVWRIAVALDATISGVRKVKPVLPACRIGTNNLHLAWASTFTNNLRDTNIGIASFGLDDLAHLTHHWLHEYATATRRPEYTDDEVFQHQVDALLVERVAMLREGHCGWIQQPAVATALQVEVDAQKYLADLPFELPQFLDYPPLAIYDRGFVYLLNQWRLISILISFFPRVNPLYRAPHSIVDVVHAIQICRAHVALDLGLSSKLFLAEFFTVVAAARTFNEGIRYRQELNWCADRIRAMDEMRHSTLVEIQEFVDAVKGLNVFKCEPWDLDLYIERDEFSGAGRFSLASLMAPFEGFQLQLTL